MRSLVVLGLCACDPSTAPREEPPPVKPAPPPPRRTPEPLQIVWGTVRDTPPCFYFSGPNGRDDQLRGIVTSDRAEIADGDITIEINGVPFTGTYRDRALAVKRVSEHTFGGAWTATEEIRGSFDGAVFAGTYTYRECEHGKACPGDCTIDADVRFERQR